MEEMYMNKKHTQTDDVIAAMKNNGGYATLAVLNQTVDFSDWKTKTPFESIRCILQRHPKDFFKIQPGLWALEEYRQSVLEKFQIADDKEKNNEKFTHAYYQGLITDIGNWQKYNTYIPNQDKNKLYLERKLGEISTLNKMPEFTYPQITHRAASIDVIWFNERKLPHSFYEVEHTTNIINSLNKFYELQDFRSRFYIVASINRRNEFDDKIHQSIYNEIRAYVKFLTYDELVNQHSQMSQIRRCSMLI